MLPDQRQFGRQFAATSDDKGNWHQMFGFHAACCKVGAVSLHPVLPFASIEWARAIRQLNSCYLVPAIAVLACMNATTGVLGNVDKGTRTVTWPLSRYPFASGSLGRG